MRELLGFLLFRELAKGPAVANGKISLSRVGWFVLRWLVAQALDPSLGGSLPQVVAHPPNAAG